MTNTNALDGMQCPECKSEEPFLISCNTVALFYDEGSDEVYDLEWDNDNACVCTKCSYTGTVRDFVRR